MTHTMFYRERVWKCGYYCEVEIYPVYQKPGTRRAKCNPTSEVQQKLNDRHSWAHLNRVIHLNFCENDHCIGLDYADGCLPGDDDQAKRDLQNVIRRMRRLYKKYMQELKYISVYEKSESGRPHFHLLINNVGVPEAELRALWKYGRTETEPLQHDNNGVVGWTKYISKSKLFSKRWFSSRNLKRPRPVERDYSLSYKRVEAFRREDEFEIYKTYGDKHIISCDVYSNDVNRADYINIKLFDYDRFCIENGKEPYARKIRYRKQNQSYLS